MNRLATRLVFLLTMVAGGFMLPVPARASVIAYWKFDPSNPTLDSSGNGHTLTDVNSSVGSSASVPTGPGIVASAGSASFNGTNSYFVSNVLNLNGQTAITVEWFMKVTSGTTGVQLPFEQTGNANLNNSRPTAQQGAFVSVLDNGSTDLHLDLVHFTNSSNDHEIFAASLTTWHHYAMVMQQVASPGSAGSTATKLELYIDGVLQTATTTPGVSGQQTTFANAELYIGARGDSNANNVANDPSLFYNGLIDELRISTGALTPDQFLDNVPEPASLSLLTASGILMLRRSGRWGRG